MMKSDQGVRKTLWTILLLQLVMWTLLPSLAHQAPPLDVVELMVSGGDGQVSTYKHPNGPGLILQPLVDLAGGSAWPAFLLSQLSILICFLVVYRLGREELGPAHALAGMLLLTGIYFYSWPTPEWNHNVAQMPLWALFSYALWRAVKTDEVGWWLALGVFAGLAMWAKYSSGLLLMVGFAWLLLDRQGRTTLTGKGPWIALISFIAVVWPQVHYLLQSDFLPLRYAAERAQSGSSGSGVSFLSAQLGYHLVMFIMAAVAGLFTRKPSVTGIASPMRLRVFLTVMTLGPPLVAVLGAAIKGAGLRDMWGAPMFNFSGLLLVAWLPGGVNQTALKRLRGFAIGLLLIVPAGYAIDLAYRAAFTDKPKRGNWPQEQMSSYFRREYLLHTGQELRYVVGPTWHAGMIAAAPGTRIEVLVEGDDAKSPHIDPNRLHRQGYLIVWRDGAPMRPTLQAFIEKVGASMQSSAVKSFRWTDSETARRIAVRYLIVGPGMEDPSGQ